MIKYKLIFNRFADGINAGNIYMNIDVATKGIDQAEAKITDLTSKIANLQSELDSAYDKNDKFQKKMVDASSTIAGGGQGLKNLKSSITKTKNNSMTSLRTMMTSPNATPEGKLALSSLESRMSTLPDMNSTKGVKQNADFAVSAQKEINAELNRRKTIQASLLKSAEQEKQTYQNEVATLNKVAQASKQAEVKNLATDWKVVESSTNKTSDAVEKYSSRLDKLIAKQNQMTRSGGTGAVSTDASRETKYADIQTDIDKSQKGLRGFINSWKELTNTIKKNTGVIDENGKVTNSASTSWDKFTKSMTGKLVRFRIITSALSGIVTTMGQLYETAAAWEESLNLYTTSLGEYAEQGRAWAEEISDALYLDPTQILQYTGAFYNLVEGLGVGSKAAYTMSTNLTQLAYDMSSYLNIDAESAYEKLTSAITGQSRAVATAGVAMQQASLQELAYSLGIKKSVSNMTQAEKTYLRYIQIMKSTSKMQGDLGKTIVTPENALRTLKTQFTLLGRAIGQVFIPFVMKAIPYVMALTQQLTALAQKLASFFGYEIADIDYSGLSSADTALESLGNTADSTADKLRGLAGFDDLNVISQPSSGTGNDDSIISQLEEEISGYDMLDKLTSQFSDNVESAKEKLSQLAKPLGVVVGLLTGFKVTSGFIKLVTKWDNFGKTVLGKNVLNSLKSVGLKFKETFSAAKASGTGLFTSISKGAQSALNPIAKIAIGITTVTSSFKSGYSSLSQWDGTFGNFAINVGKAAVSIGIFSTTAGLLIGSTGAIITAVAGIAGAFIGVSTALENYYRSLTEQERYNTLFDNTGASIEAITTSFQNGVDDIVEYGNTVEELAGKIGTTKTTVDETFESLKDVHDILVSGDYEDAKTIIDELKSKNEEYKDAVNNNKDANVKYYNTVLENLNKQGALTDEKYAKMKETISNYYTKLALYESDYADQLTNLDIQLANGTIKQEEYNKAVNDLAAKYAGVVDSTIDVKESLADLYATSAGNINLENPKQLKSLVDSLKKSYDEGKTSIESQKKTAKEMYESQRDELQKTISSLEGYKKIHGELSTVQQAQLTAAKDTLQTITTTYTAQMKQFDTDTQGLTDQYANYMATIYAQISQAGKLTDSDVKGTVKTIKEEMSNLSTFDTSNAVYDLFGKLTDSYVKEGKTFETGTLKTFSNWGIEFSDAYANALQSGMESYQKKAEETLDKNATKYASLSKKAFKTVGENVCYGIEDGIDYKSSVASDSIEDVTDDMEGKFCDETEIHSPSKLYARLGKYLVQGLSNGITDSTSEAITAIKTLTDNLQSSMSNVNLAVNIDTSIESSLNSMLNKLQTFCTNWRNAINSLAAGMKSTMNGITLDKNGKVTYTSMPKITVAKFAEGGFPDAGDLFIANEAGPEFITSIGNKSAVANQDQMVAALSNAIMAGLSRVQTNTQPVNTNVYIGNEKVYSGQSRYQNRQTDRYGTNYIKV